MSRWADATLLRDGLDRVLLANSSSSFDYDDSEDFPSDIAAVIFTASMLFLATVVMTSCYCVYRHGESLRWMFFRLPCAAPDRRYRRRDRIQDVRLALPPAPLRRFYPDLCRCHRT